MRELALHLLDLAQNSLAACATWLQLDIEAEKATDRLRLTLRDNGRGIPRDQLAKVLDPFYTTRTTRHVGLGLPMLKAAAERCGGDLTLASVEGRGTTVTAEFRLSHIDRAPLGDLAGTILALAACNPALDLELHAGWDGAEFSFSTRECRSILGPEVGLSDPGVFAYLRSYLAGGLADLRRMEEAAVGPERRDEPMADYRTNVLVCAGAGCLSCGCRPVKDALLAEIQRQGLEREVRVVETGCVGRCDLGPVVLVYPEGVFYQHVAPADVPEIVSEHLLKGRIVARLLPVEESGPSKELADLKFFRGQTRIALRNVGLIEPTSIDEYIGRDGYAALAKALTEMTPDGVIEELTRSGLRGRGGAGFPTGMKWHLTAKVPGETKYIICNADEGDPGAFMDRSILEGDPHSVLEAMAIAGYAVGARQGYVYVRAEYPLAVERLGHAIKQARAYGLLGAELFGTKFAFDVDIRVGAGAFVCGEETALIASIEGHRGEPRTKPPFPAAAGLWGKPTLNNNVETYANVPPIILKGAEWFSGIGTEKSKGTKVFALAGKCRNTGLVEVPMGTALRTLVYDLGGGVAAGKEFKAAQVGGPAGACLGAELLDLPMDYESLRVAGAMMGSGGLIIMDNDNCMVDTARYFLEFTQDESCGRCTPCRIGTRKMLEIMLRITQGQGKMEDLETLETLGNMIRISSLCGLGQAAPNPVLSTLRFFREEYEAHILEKRCPAGVCRALLHYEVDPDLCRGCGLCTRVCPAGAIRGESKKAHTIDPEMCQKCGACESKCTFKAIKHH